MRGLLCKLPRYRRDLPCSIGTFLQLYQRGVDVAHYRCWLVQKSTSYWQHSVILPGESHFHDLADVCGICQVWPLQTLFVEDCIYESSDAVSS